MRLINADALKEDLRRFFPVEVLEGIEPKTLFAQIMHDIDNAPTVEADAQDFKSEIFRMVNMGVYPEAIIEWVREQM